MARQEAGARRRPRWHALTVARVERLTDDAVAVTFDVPEELAEDYRFRPGQALTLRRVDGDRDERRSYSICAPVGEAPRVGVWEVPGGFLSSYLVHSVSPGDRIEVLPPSGTFTADLSTPADHLFVVAGSGITPALSLAASVLRDGRSTVTVFYGNRRTSTVMFADELADLKDRYGTRLQLVHVLSQEARDAGLTTGRLDRHRLRTLVEAFLDPEQVNHWWLCGPHRMVADARELLAELGVTGDRVHQQLFFVDDVPPQPVRGDADLVAGPSSQSPWCSTDGRPPWPFPAMCRSSTPRSGCAVTCPTPARAGSAVPAGRGFASARSRCGATTPSSRTRWRPGTCSPASRCPCRTP